MRTSQITVSSFVLGALAMGFAACGGGGSGSSSGTNASSQNSGGHGTSTTGAAALNTSLDPCSLVTQQQVAQAVGMSVDPGKSDTSAPGSRDCTWKTSAGDAGAGASSIASVTVEVSGPNPALKSRYPTAQSYYEFTKKVVSSAHDVSGVGDAAFMSNENHWLYALKGNVVLRVFATFGTSEAAAPAIEQIMKDALANT